MNSEDMVARDMLGMIASETASSIEANEFTCLSTSLEGRGQNGHVVRIGLKWLVFALETTP